MTAFENIETTQNVETDPGLLRDHGRRAGRDPPRRRPRPRARRADVGPDRARQFPAVATLDADWVHILNDMTPMIGAMSDNVADYQAIASLPPVPTLPVVLRAPRRAGGGLGRGGRIAAPSHRRSPSAETTTCRHATPSSRQCKECHDPIVSHARVAARVAAGVGRTSAGGTAAPARPRRASAPSMPSSARSSSTPGACFGDAVTRDLLPDDLPGRHRGHAASSSTTPTRPAQQDLHAGRAGHAGRSGHGQVPAQPDTRPSTRRAARWPDEHRPAAELHGDQLLHRHQQGRPPDRHVPCPRRRSASTERQAVGSDRGLVGRVEQALLQPGLAQAERHARPG